MSGFDKFDDDGLESLARDRAVQPLRECVSASSGQARVASVSALSLVAALQAASRDPDAAVREAASAILA
ncbi:MAG: hypothetical protein JWN40_2337 [Phycisphaerales bacterium]|jgi:hypothetical protein|nr:hypothetical protein [Phycisphaerales bacterium]